MDMKIRSEPETTPIPKNLIKPALKIGDVTLVPVDKSIVKDLKITENTYFQQEQSADGINLRILKRTDFL
jgi:hypothetical protein